MKKNIKTILFFLAALLIFSKASAQKNNRQLSIGDKVPDLTISNLLNYPTNSLKISDFKGKLLIIDFWATWCSPCVAMIPKMDSIQNKFNGKVRFLPVTNQPRKTVITFLKKLNEQRPFNLPDVLEDTLLNDLFPHTYLPHYVWIGQSGKIIGITGYEAINDINIQKALFGQDISLAIKIDKAVDGDPAKLFSVDTTNNKIVHKLIPGYQEDYPSKWVITPDDSINGKSIEMTNMTMPTLFNIAFGENKIYFGNNRIIYKVRDSDNLTKNVSGDAALEWMREGHVYSYVVKTPRGMENLAYKMMQQDLKNYFKAYDVSIVNMPTECLALIRTTSEDKLKSKGGKSEANADLISFHLKNFPLQRLVAVLSNQYMSKSPYPIVDKTGYKSWVDIDINARLSNVDAVNKELEKYGLRLQLMTLPLDKMVIRDANVTN